MASTNTTGGVEEAGEIFVDWDEFLKWITALGTKLKIQNETIILLELLKETGTRKHLVRFLRASGLDKVIELFDPFQKKTAQIGRPSLASPNPTTIEDEILELTGALNELLPSLVACAEDASSILHRLADEIDKTYKLCNKGKYAGSISSLMGLFILVAGTVTSVVLPPYLATAGALLSGFGGIVSGGSGLTEYFVTKSKCKKAQGAFDALREMVKAFDEDLKRLEKLLQSAVADSAVQCTSWFPCFSSIRFTEGVRMATSAVVILSGFQKWLRFLGMAAAVFGSVLAAPFDIYTLANSTVKAHRSTGSLHANKIRELSRVIYDFAQQLKQ